MKTIRFIDLFAGIGGFRYGLEKCNDIEATQSKRDTKPRADSSDLNRKPRTPRGSKPAFSCVWSNEWDKYASQIYKKHFGECDTRDIRTVKSSEIPEFDLLVGGFPCQSFSIAGKRKGFEDTRGTLFFDIARILKDKKPKYFILENVKGLLSSHTTLTFEGILDTLSTELSINICLSQFQPIKEWEVETDNLSVYLQSIGKISGLQKNLKSLADQILQTIKKQNYFLTEKMPQSGLSEEEWVSNLQWLYSTDNIQNLDISMLEKMVATNATLVSLLKKQSEGNLDPKKLYTTSTEIKETTPQTTFISVLQEMNIMLFIIKQWKLSNNLWHKIESSSEKVNTYYVKTFNIIISELEKLGYDIEWQIVNSKNFGVPQNRERVFIIGHLRGTNRPKVFPVGESGEQTSKLYGQQTGAITARRGQAKSDGDYVVESNGQALQYIGGIIGKRDKWLKDGKDNSRNFSQGQRVYGTKGISSTLAGNAGGLGGKTGLYAIPVLTPDRLKKRQNGRRFKNDGEPAFTLTGQDIHGVMTDTMKIRRLTPTECERLQGFPDGWTEFGTEGRISDTQRYKTLGNAVSTPVVTWIGKQLLK